MNTPYHNVSNEGLRELIAKTPELQLIDVRTPAEYYEHGHIQGAELKPVQEIEDWAPTLDKSKPMAFLCKGGVRSVHACHYMVDTLGINPEETPLYNLEDGMKEWDGDLIYDDVANSNA